MRFCGEQIDQIQARINSRVLGQERLFEDEQVSAFVEQLYVRIIKNKKVDIVATKSEIDIDTADLNTLKNKDVRELGAEWMSLQIDKQLGFDRFLASRKWNDEDISLAISHIVSRAVYPASELKTVRIMEDNSSICELTGYDVESLTKDRLYQITRKLYAEVDE